ncbi:MAG: hypothetical protein Q4Q17_03345 [Tissierellia bacterium]|nr:hypothetical protein [Tissierellia bacterium]
MNHEIVKGMEFLYFLFPILNLLYTVVLIASFRKGRFPLTSWGEGRFQMNRQDVKDMDQERRKKLHAYLWLGGLMGVVASFFVGYGMVVTLPNTYLYLAGCLLLQVGLILYFWHRRREDMGKLNI